MQVVTEPLPRPTPKFTVLLGWSFVLLLSLFFLNAKGTLDVKALLIWDGFLTREGITAGYEHSGTDYPPFSLVLVHWAEQAGSAISLPSILALKWSIFVFLLATSLTVYGYTRSLLVAGVLQLGLLVNSVAQGYIDVYFAPFLVLALWGIRHGWLPWVVGWFTVACLIKWQVAVLGPFVGLLLIKTCAVENPFDWRRLGTSLLPAVAIVGGTFMLFGGAVVQSLFYALTKSTYLSGNALNFNWIFTYLLHQWDPTTYGPLVKGQVSIIMTESAVVTLVPRLMFAALYLFSLVRYWRARIEVESFLVYASFGYLAYFEFNPGVHENHLFPACILLALLCQRGSIWNTQFAIWLVLLNTNLLMFYGIDGRGLPFSVVLSGVDLTVITAGLSIAAFLQFGRLVVAQAQVQQASNRQISR